jgi:hypothetical protein
MISYRYSLILLYFFIWPITVTKSKIASKIDGLYTFLLNKNVDIGWGFLFKTKKRFTYPPKISYLTIKEKSSKTPLALKDEEKKQLAEEIIKNTVLHQLIAIKFQDRTNDDQIKNYKVLLPLWTQVHSKLMESFANDIEFYTKNLDELNSKTIEQLDIYFNAKEALPLGGDPVLYYATIDNENFIMENKIRNLITETVDGYKNPMGRFYLSCNLTQQKLWKYVEIFDINVGINWLFSGSCSLDPFFLPNGNFQDCLFAHFLTGLQLPDFLSIIPSSGALYLKIFFVLGFIVETTEKGSIKILAGTVFCFGFKEYGYIRFEMLNDIHHSFQMTINLIKKFFNTYIFSHYKMEEKEKLSLKNFLTQDFIESLSFYSIYFVRGRNNLFKSDFSRFLSKKVQANIKVFMDNSHKKKTIQPSLSMNHRP